jgi:hypothetical protein
MSDLNKNRRAFMARGAYVAPAILTLAAVPEFAKAGSVKPGSSGPGGDARGAILGMPARDNPAPQTPPPANPAPTGVTHSDEGPGAWSAPSFDDDFVWRKCLEWNTPATCRRRLRRR